MANRGFKILPKNYLDDFGEFEAWADGTVPSGWQISTGVTYSSSTPKWGLAALQITGLGGVYRTIPNGTGYQGRTFKLGFWAKSASTGPYIMLSDGVATKTVHADGLNAFAFITTPEMKVDYAATKLQVNIHGFTAVAAVFDGGVLCEGSDLFLDLNNNIDISTWSPSLNMKADQYEIANSEGSYIPETHLQARNIKVTGNVVGSDVASCRTHFDNLMKGILAWQATEKRNMYLYDDRVLECFLKGFDWNYINGLQMIKFNMTLSVPSAVSRSIGKYRTSQAITGTVTEFNVPYNGSAESKPYIRIIAGGTAITTCSLQNLTTGQSLAYTGTVPANAALDIDCLTASVMNSGVDKISDFTGDFIGLVRGTNNFRFAGSNCTIKIDYFEKWY